MADRSSTESSDLPEKYSWLTNVDIVAVEVEQLLNALESLYTDEPDHYLFISPSSAPGESSTAVVYSGGQDTKPASSPDGSQAVKVHPERFLSDGFSGPSDSLSATEASRAALLEDGDVTLQEEIDIFGDDGFYDWRIGVEYR